MKEVKDQKLFKENVINSEIVEEMEKSYIDYAMSVIVQRALPSVEDGLKPVHRRILYAMNSIGLDFSKPTKKSAAVVGEVLGKYHPHGDSSVYDAMVRLAQYFSLRYPLVHGQGNFGSMDGDSPAAMRYTEAKLSKISMELLQDIDKDTVKMNYNFDNSTKEPDTLPGKLPNLLLNGATGIAVGMATNIPPHNLRELCDAIIKYIENKNVSIEELAEIVTGPDFPTGGIITGPGIKEMYKTGKGRVNIRAKTKTEEKNGRTNIIIQEIPYMVNKADLVKNIAKLYSEKKLPDVSDLRDESAKQDVRIVIELKKGATAKYTLNKLFKFTRLQTAFDANILALVGKQPKVLNLKNVMEEYVKYRSIIITNRSKFELRKAEERLEIVEGLLKALKNINKIIEFIKKSKGTKEAHEGLVKNFSLTERQAKAVLETRLQQLTSMESEKLENEGKKLREVIEKLKKILGSEQEVLKVIKKEVKELRDNYGDDRKTKIVARVDEISEQDLVEKKDVVVLITHTGYIKRMDLQTYREQKRGGSGVIGTGLKDGDFVSGILSCSTHDYVLFFTTRGRVFWIKGHEIPSSERQSKGRSLANLLNLRDEDVAKTISLSEARAKYLFFCTRKGMVKKIAVDDLGKPRASGVRVINLPGDGSDSIINVIKLEESEEVLLTTKKGQAIRFNSDNVRAMGRASYGVKGIELASGDDVISVDSMPKGKKTTILTITQKGYGKRTELEEYRKTARAGKGIINMKVSDRTGDVIGSLSVDKADSVIMTTSKGMTLRTNMKDIRPMGRATQGVKVIRIKPDDNVAAIVKIPYKNEI